nr:hypothetical protein [uncultured Campylobacter sp.]
MDIFWIDLIKIGFGALLAVGGQFVHVHMTSKKDKNKLRQQKLEEIFIIIGGILVEMGKDRFLSTNPNLNIENRKIDISKLHLLISLYAPEPQEDYKDFMTTYQDCLSLYVRIYDSNSNDTKNLTENKLMKISSLLASKGNKIKEKLITMAKEL